MHGHVPPDAAGGGEDHVAAAALEHPRVVMRGQVGVQAAAAGIRHQYQNVGVIQIFTSQSFCCT